MHFPIEIRGFRIFREYLNASRQRAMVDEMHAIALEAPLFFPMTPFGKRMSVRMTSAGKYGWYSDRKGYRYERRHPNGQSWPMIPKSVLEIWRNIVDTDRMPDCCLINYYGEKSRMGMHQDSDEADFQWPVLSISLGDDALFRIGNRTRGGSTESIWLNSGDVVLMGGSARLHFHGVDKIRVGSSTLLSGGGRINLTCRVVD